MGHIADRAQSGCCSERSRRLPPVPRIVSIFPDESRNDSKIRIALFYIYRELASKICISALLWCCSSCDLHTTDCM